MSAPSRSPADGLGAELRADGPSDAGATRRALVAELRRAATLEALARHPEYPALRRELDALLGAAEVVIDPAVRPRLGGFLRVVQWNIEKGKRFDRIVETLAVDPVLAGADLLLLNEVDHGMRRSDNRHVGRDLAAALGTNLAFAPAHLELTKGTGAELATRGENQASLQGNAILTRYPILEARVVRLPSCFEPFHFHEKRYGGRSCLWARLRIGDRDWWVGAVHLEVRDTPACRLRQVEHLLARVPAGAAGPCLLGGDLNTSGFARGTRWRTLRSVWRLTAHRAARVERELCRPDLGAEPLFSAFARAGFAWDRLNGAEATAAAPLADLEDARLLPAWLRAAIRARLAPYGPALRMRLDWLLGRGVEPLGAGEGLDEATDLRSLAPGTRAVPEPPGEERISDHLPIHADLATNGIPRGKT